MTPESALGDSSSQEVSKCGEASPPHKCGICPPYCLLREAPQQLSPAMQTVPLKEAGRGEPRPSPKRTNLPAGGGLAEVDLQAHPLGPQESQAVVGLAQQELLVLQLLLGPVLGPLALPKGHQGGVELLLGGVELLLDQEQQVPALFQVGLQDVDSVSQDAVPGCVVLRCLLELLGGLQVWRESGCG